MIGNPFKMDGPFIKCCGMTREVDMHAVNDAAPQFCGFIINFPKSHRNVDLERAEELASMLSDDIYPVGVFVNEPIETIIKMVRHGIITTVQLHGDEDEDYVNAVRDDACPSAIIKAFTVRTEEDVERACQSSADMILLDSGKGSGETFDWSICSKATRPFILAGGLSPDNVAQAIQQVHPWAVDMSSGLETDGLKDETKIAKAVAIVKEQ